jgi:hypothetical protein
MNCFLGHIEKEPRLKKFWDIWSLLLSTYPSLVKVIAAAAAAAAAAADEIEEGGVARL